ncbi:MAG: DinB family protein [Bacteroidetes bacterium]|nr:DinB family protein [Bacteroidota bacterium]
MGLKKLIDNYAAFNLWANNHFVTWLQSLDTQLLYQQMPSSFTSIDFTLQHILRTQKYWLAFVCEKDTSTFSWAVFENEVERILEELNTQSEEMHNTISSFSEEQLLAKLILDSPWAKNQLSRYEYILHVINHSTYHRGQIITMARNIGISEHIPATDYNFFNTQLTSK